MKIIKAPKRFYKDDEGGRMLFLAGSIEMGKAENWQTKVTDALKKEQGYLLNPRRDDWDSSWKQEIDNPQFREQVEWELNALGQADIIALYFDPNTRSPISLLELGMFGGPKMVVYCPKGFWRKGNVDVVCRKRKIVTCVSMEDFINELRLRLQYMA